MNLEPQQELNTKTYLGFALLESAGAVVLFLLFLRTTEGVRWLWLAGAVLMAAAAVRWFGKARRKKS